MVRSILIMNVEKAMGFNIVRGHFCVPLVILACCGPVDGSSLSGNACASLPKEEIVDVSKDFVMEYIHKRLSSGSAHLFSGLADREFLETVSKDDIEFLSQPTNIESEGEELVEFNINGIPGLAIVVSWFENCGKEIRWYSD